uniref:Uncharacterized protein n=1 Tax=Arion vulgaris TaxID=1028688 RepID=A0A0B6Z6K4_9EUPU
MSSESLSYCLNGADASSWYNPYCLFSLASSQQPSCHDSINSCFVTPTAHLTPAPPISYPITSKITNSAVFNNSNSYANNTSIPNVSHSNTELSRYQNVYEVFSSQSPLHKTNLSDKSQLESLILSPSSSKLNRIEHEPSPQVIFPAPLPSSSSTVTAPLCGGGAKLDPPPQFRRTIRPIESRGQGSWLDVSLDQLPESNTSQKDVGIDMDIGQF